MQGGGGGGAGWRMGEKMGKLGGVGWGFKGGISGRGVGGLGWDGVRGENAACRNLAANPLEQPFPGRNLGVVGGKPWD